MDLQKYLVHRDLCVNVDDHKGRCLIAGRDFHPGEIILRQLPYSSVLSDETERKLCNFCFTQLTSVQWCSACKSIFYCSRECQAKEWKFHKHECKILLRLKKEKKKLPPSVLLVVRLLLKRHLQESEVLPRTVNDNFENVEALPTHFSEIADSRMLLYSQMAGLVKAILDPLDVDLRETCQLFCRIACNAHSICDAEFRPVGTGLFSVVSIINHSCVPNSVLLFDGKEGVVRVLQKIEVGTEVTLGYVELAGSTITRQKALKEQYYFVCNCQRCLQKETTSGIIEDSILEGYKCCSQSCDGLSQVVEDERRYCCPKCGLYFGVRQLNSQEFVAKSLSEEADLAINADDSARARQLLQEMEEIQQKLHHEHSVHLMRTRDALIKVCMSLHDWLSALSFCRRTLPAYERAYASSSPLLGLQYFTFGKLHWFLGNALEAVEFLAKAKEILSISHGSSAPLVQQLSTTLMDANAEVAFTRRLT